ncbi:MAG TPA: hypothetical protein V6C90_12115 [Coleofasciculaceae cyanobacterium]
MPYPCSLDELRLLHPLTAFGQSVRDLLGTISYSPKLDSDRA